MCTSIREFGFKIPCLVRSDGEVVDGHLRLKAARSKLGITDIPVILCDEWTPAQAKAFAAAGEPVRNVGGLGRGTAGAELRDLNVADYDLSLTGFDSKELDRYLLTYLLTDEESTPPLPDHPVTNSGDLWLCGSHRVLLRGCNRRDGLVSRLLGQILGRPY